MTPPRKKGPLKKGLPNAFQASPLYGHMAPPYATGYMPPMGNPPMSHHAPPPAPVTTMSDRILGLRTRMNLTRVQFAYMLGTTELTVWRWETGAAKPEGAAAALLNALEQQVQQLPPQNLGEIIGKVALGAVAGAALLAVLAALFGDGKK